ncbi:MAG TPA: hypothetical protein VE954_43340 [Oligoflexus sp.]|uniref:hypothetical protein n=1 Tax=Oligoflexus sp. TaxID=1971216 RepID=UPI002D65F220|nr:hypothetical protein [Oligoflexus sp.]HYX39980.1 hypothetical protein [Oligoflexus sp.]
MIVTTKLDLPDLIHIVAALRFYAGKVGEYGGAVDSEKFRAIADRVVEEVRLNAGQTIG